jgi:hypothetical protein
MDYQFEAAWPCPTPELFSDVVRFWTAESALSVDVALQRARQLLVVARTSQRVVAAVSTAVRVHVRQLGFECFYYRTYVGRRHRARGLVGTGLLQTVARKSFDVLEARFLSGIDRDVLGIYMETENRKLMRVWNVPVWQEMGANIVYIGRTPEGCDMRVWYFAGARLPRVGDIGGTWSPDAAGAAGARAESLAGDQ